LRPFFAFLMVLGAVSASRPARADAEPNAAEEARRLYAEAHAHYLAGRCPSAMPLLVRAEQLVASPNAGLLVARCLLADGRKVAAAERFADVERTALDRVRAGETRYAETAAAAAKEGAALRATLGRLRIRAIPRDGVAMEIDGQPAALGATGDTTFLHEPGVVKIARISGARREERTANVIAEREAIVSFDREPAHEDAARPSAPETGSRRAPMWPLYASGAIAIAGVGTFVGFGLASEATYSDLEARCAPACGPNDVADADRGRGFQTVANVGLVVGVVAAAVFGTLLLVR
jgi:hypothetical protein